MMKVLVVLGEGGHTTEMLRLVESLGPIYDYSYLSPAHDRTSEGKIKIAGLVYRSSLPRKKNTPPWTTFKLSLLCAVQQLWVLLRVRPKAILSTGAGIAVPVSVFGRLLGVKIIHVETASRVHTLSLTGRIMYRLAHLFFVQWEPLKQEYPKAIYAGRLL
jgi:UDP-N-acetylglucosamine:LPS N-acetylglucosamine transferase